MNSRQIISILLMYNVFVLIRGSGLAKHLVIRSYGATQETTIVKSKQGSSTRLECNFEELIEKTELNSNSFDHKILWLRENRGVIAINNQIKSNTSKYLIYLTKYSSNLIINNLDPDDDGKYICQHFDFSMIKPFTLVVLGECYWNCRFDQAICLTIRPDLKLHHPSR
jgi:hypothetical protein